MACMSEFKCKKEKRTMQSNKGHAENAQQKDDLTETAEPGKILFSICYDKSHHEPHHWSKYEEQQKANGQVLEEKIEYQYRQQKNRKDDINEELGSAHTSEDV